MSTLQCNGAQAGEREARDSGGRVAELLRRLRYLSGKTYLVARGRSAPQAQCHRHKLDRCLCSQVERFLFVVVRNRGPLLDA